MMMKRALLTVTVWLLPTLAGAQTAPEHQKVRALLATIDTPATKAQLLQASAQAESILLSVVADESAAPWHRDRALSALGMFPSRQVQAVLRSVFRDQDADELRRSRALLAYGAAFSDAAIAETSGFLTHASPVLRTTAVQTLGHIKTPKARGALRQALKAHPELRGPVERALKR